MKPEHLLDDEYIRKETKEWFFFNKEFIKVINVLELIFYIYMYYDFYGLVLYFMENPIRINCSVCFVPTGWEFILLSILIFLNVYILSKNKMTLQIWVIKIAAIFLLTISLTNELLYECICYLLIIYYLLNPVSKKFGVFVLKKKLLYLLIIFLASILLAYLIAYFKNLIEYY